MSDAPVRVLQRERELTELLELYREERPRSVLEIGVAQGGTLFYWLRDSRDDVRVTVVAVDDFAEHEDNRSLFPLWAPPNVELHVIEGSSSAADVAAHVFEICDRFDWVFIDADHGYDAVLTDWLLYGQRAHTVCFHDIVSNPAVHPEIEVARLWGEIRIEHKTLEIVDDVHADWGGIGVVWPSRD